jgi:hypothetical protein
MRRRMLHQPVRFGRNRDGSQSWERGRDEWWVLRVINSAIHEKSTH